MEGIGYWVFLLVLYLLSGLLKKKRRTEARRRLENEDEPRQTQPESAGQPEWLKNIFQDLSGLKDEIQPLVEQDIQEDEPLPYVEPETVPEEEMEEDYSDVSEFVMDMRDSGMPTEPDHHDDSILEQPVTKQGFLVLLHNKSGLRNAILLKEVLDKPRALRPSIR
ncbi:MAG: hypothetical protein GXO90_00010 [FCB group bacterium]|nr:hypothetical protein [FCB group bacterium]